MNENFIFLLDNEIEIYSELSQSPDYIFFSQIGQESINYLKRNNFFFPNFIIKIIGTSVIFSPKQACLARENFTKNLKNTISSNFSTFDSVGFSENYKKLYQKYNFRKKMSFDFKKESKKSNLETFKFFSKHVIENYIGSEKFQEFQELKKTLKPIIFLDEQNLKYVLLKNNNSKLTSCVIIIFSYLVANNLFLKKLFLFVPSFSTDDNDNDTKAKERDKYSILKRLEEKMLMDKFHTTVMIIILALLLSNFSISLFCFD
jgi:hypothetical protein